jgi:hypothetical protein
MRAMLVAARARGGVYIQGQLALTNRGITRRRAGLEWSKMNGSVHGGRWRQVRKGTVQATARAPLFFFSFSFFVFACAEQSLLSCPVVFSCIHVEKKKAGRSQEPHACALWSFRMDRQAPIRFNFLICFREDNIYAKKKGAQAMCTS